MRSALTAAAMFLCGALPVFAGPPAAPSALKVAPLGTSGQVLAWMDQSTDETGFVIERLDGASWTVVASVAAGTTRLVLQSQPAGTQTYRVLAVNGDGASPLSPQAATIRMNVLFFLADDMGYKDIVAHRNPATDGPTIYETPALDSLVAQGVTFRRSYCSGPKCVVARRTLMTGMYDFRRAAVPTGGGIGTEMVTLGEAMKGGGYRTAFIGKWHLGGRLVGSTGGDETDAGGSFPPYTESTLNYDVNTQLPVTDPNHFESNKVPSMQGYDVSIASGEWGAPPIDPGTGTNPQSGGYFPRQIGTTGDYWYGLPNLYTTNPSEYLTDRLTSEATGFIGTHVANHPTQPFFLTLAHYAVHTPLQADPARVAYFQTKRAAMAAQFDTHPAGAAFKNDYTSVVRQHQDQTIYAAMMDSFDDSLASIRTYLAATDDPRHPGLKLSDTTIIVLSSDHGGKSTHALGAPDNAGIPTANYPLRQGKTWCYEGGLRIPLIVYWPGMTPSGGVSDSLVNGADIYTSILDMTGSPRVPAQHLDSISFAEATVNPTVQARQESPHWFTNADTGTGNPALGAYRAGDYKLVYHMIRRIWELYDLARDPGETNDIASLRPDLVSEYYARLSRRLVEVDGRRPVPGSNSWDSELQVIAPVVTVPTAVPNGIPSGLTGSVISDTAIDLAWTDASSNEDRFVIQRKLSGAGAFVEIATVPANVTRFRDTGLDSGVTYQYRIQAENLRGWAGPSNTYSGTTTSAVLLPVIARGDDITTLVNEVREFLPLANDQGKNLLITAISQPLSKGTAVITNGGSSIRFTPYLAVTGTDSMTYTTTDSSGRSATGIISLTILADHTVTPALIYDLCATERMVDDWEFDDAANTTIANCANSANSAIKFSSGATPRTDGAGALNVVTSGGASNTFRTTATVSPGEKTLGTANAGIYELSLRYSAADLSGGDNDGAYAGAALRDQTTSTDLFGFRLQEAAGKLELQFRNPSSVVLHTFASNTLSAPVSVRGEANLETKMVTVSYDIGAGPVLKGVYPLDPAALKWNSYRIAAANNSTDFGAADYIKIDYLRVKFPPTPYQRWIDAAQGTTSPNPNKSPLADPDGDGVANVVEYAFGGRPWHSGLIPQFAGQDAAGDPLTLTLPVLPGTNFAPLAGMLTGRGHGLTYTIQGSLDLTNFNALVEEVYPPLESGLPPVPRGWEYRSFRLVSPGATRGFLRAATQLTP